MKHRYSIFALCFALGMAGCNDPGPAPGPSGNGVPYGILLKQIPPLTSPVEGTKAVHAGTRLADWQDLVWDDKTSGPMCETGNVMRNHIETTAFVDRAICYLKAYESLGAIELKYDRKVQNFLFKLPGGELSARLVGVREGDLLTDFALNLDLQTEDRFSQYAGRYRNQKGNAELRVGGIVQIGNEEYTGQTGNVFAGGVGKVSSDFRWIERTTNTKLRFTRGYLNDRYPAEFPRVHFREVREDATVRQTKTDAEVSAAFDGYGVRGSGPRSGSLVSRLGIGDPERPSTFRISDGVAKYQVALDYAVPPVAAGPSLAGFDGETRAPLASSLFDFASAILAQIFPTLPSPPYGFDDDFFADLNGVLFEVSGATVPKVPPTEVVVTPEMLAAQAACDRDFSFLGPTEAYTTVDCSEADFTAP